MRLPGILGRERKLFLSRPAPDMPFAPQVALLAQILWSPKGLDSVGKTHSSNSPVDLTGIYQLRSPGNGHTFEEPYFLPRPGNLWVNLATRAP